MITSSIRMYEIGRCERYLANDPPSNGTQSAVGRIGLLGYSLATYCRTTDSPVIQGLYVKIISSSKTRPPIGSKQLERQPPVHHHDSRGGVDASAAKR